jgi:hypothetical protein
MLEIEEASDNDLALNFIYYKTCLVYDDFLYNTSKLLEKNNTSPLYSILSLDVKSNRIDFIYKQEVIDLLQTVNQLSNLKNFATKLYASDVNIQNYLITEKHLN